MTTVAPRPALSVSAVLVVRDGARWLPETLDAVAAQSAVVTRLVVVDLASSDGSGEIAEQHGAVHRVIESVVVHRSQVRGYADAVAAGMAALPPTADGSQEWLWLLHDDGAPERDALELLLDAVRRSPSVGVAGPKVVRWEDPRVFVENGIQLTRAGRRISSPHPGELDQGQYDARSDVIAVATNGMLVRRDVYDELGGFFAGFGPLGVDVDFGWRAQLAGHRVVVVPGARVREASASVTGDRQGAPSPWRAELARRRAARQVAIARSSALAAPFLGLWIAASSLLMGLGLLLLKRPRHAWAEFGDIGAVFHPGPVLRSRRRARATRRVEPRDLHGLFISPKAALRQTWDTVQDALTPSWTAERRAPAQVAPVESGPVAEEAEDLTVASSGLLRRAVTNPGFLATLVAALCSGALWRGAWSAFRPDALGLAGGELRAVATDADGLWHAFRDSWHGAGLGFAAEPQPLTAVLSALTWVVERVPGVSDGRSPAAVMLAWALLLAMPASAVSAYLAGRVVTTARWPRAFGALVWASSGVLIAALSQGRLSAVLAHVLLPPAVAGFARVAAPGATATATFATALVTGLLGVCVPAFLALSVLAGLVLLAVGPGTGRRLRAAVLVVVPTALTGAWVLGFVRDPVLLLDAPGLAAPRDGGPAGLVSWQAALGLVSPLDGLGAYLMAPVLALALAALAWPTRRRGQGAARLALGLLAVVGLGLTVLGGRLVLGPLVSADGTVSEGVLWPGVGGQLYLVSVTALAVLAAASLGGVRRSPPWRGVLTAGVALLAVGSSAASAGLALVDARPLPAPVLTTALPAVASEAADGPLASRLLVLDVGASGVDYQLVGAEPGEIMRGVTLARRTSDPVVDALVADLVAGRAAPGTVTADLATEGIGFVTVAGEAGADLARRLDGTGGLTRLGSADGRILWRVLATASATDESLSVSPSRVQIVTDDGAVVASVPVDGPHGIVSTDLAASAVPRILRVAEPAAWADRSVVRFQGQIITAAVIDGRPTYRLPQIAGSLDVDVPPAHRFWHVGQLVLLGLVVFLAVPFGNRRSRQRGWAR